VLNNDATSSPLPHATLALNRYLGDQGSLVEFSLDFAAPLSFKGCEPTSSSSSKTKIHFRGVIESNASKVYIFFQLLVHVFKIDW